MSAQVNDRFQYNDKSYSISAIQFSHKFFNISQIGIEPEAEHTACWRGYVAEFSMYQNKLVLKNLYTNNGNGKTLPIAINGVMPIVEKPSGFVENYRKWNYHDVNLEIPYTGAILITDDFIRERYIHMGFQSPLSYRKVIELCFNCGTLVEEKDLSKIAELLRKKQLTESHDEKASRLPIWIDECFDLSYRTKWLSDEDA